jgi:hypothetical protein
MICPPGYAKFALLMSQLLLAFFTPDTALHHKKATLHQQRSSFDLF